MNVSRSVLGSFFLSALAGCFTYSEPARHPQIDAYLIREYGTSDLQKTHSQYAVFETDGPNEFLELAITLAEFPRERFRVERPETGNVKIAVKLLGHSDAAIDQFRERHVASSGHLFDITPDIYCYKVNDDASKIAGVCIYEVVVLIPETSNTAVSINGERVMRPAEVWTRSDLKARLANLLPSETTEQIFAIYVESQRAKRFLTMNDVLETIAWIAAAPSRSMDSTPWRTVIDRLTGHVTDPENSFRAVVRKLTDDPAMIFPVVPFVEAFSERGYPVPWRDVTDLINTIDLTQASLPLIGTALGTYPDDGPIISANDLEALMAVERRRPQGQMETIQRLLGHRVLR